MKIFGLQTMLKSAKDSLGWGKINFQHSQYYLTIRRSLLTFIKEVLVEGWEQKSNDVFKSGGEVQKFSSKCGLQISCIFGGKEGDHVKSSKYFIIYLFRVYGQICSVTTHSKSYVMGTQIRREEEKGREKCIREKKGLG